jgi:hypothetical protein
MKPMLHLELLLGGAAPTPFGRAISPTDELGHRAVHIVWANGEGSDTPMPTRGTALLQHGFKEWSGAYDLSMVAGSRTDPAAPAAVWHAVRQCELDYAVALVFCRDLQAPMHVLQELRRQGGCALLALGSPAFAGTGLPAPASPLPRTVDSGPCLWLGAPDGLPPVLFPMPGSLRVTYRALYTNDIGAHLQAAEAQLVWLAPAAVCALLFLDDVAIGVVPGSASAGVPAAALAGTLRWLQRLAMSVVVFVVSHERVTPDQRGSFGELARHLGRTMHRHADGRR